MRIYCDNDARFELIPDGQEVIDKTNPRKNSKRHPEDQEWIDSINKIYAHGVLARGADAYAATYGAEKGEDSDLDKDPSNNPRRTSITVSLQPKLNGNSTAKTDRISSSRMRGSRYMHLNSPMYGFIHTKDTTRLLILRATAMSWST